MLWPHLQTLNNAFLQGFATPWTENYKKKKILRSGMGPKSLFIPQTMYRTNKIPIKNIVME
jgi:hypothetical protein